MTDRVVKTFDLIPMQHSLPKTTPVQSRTSATVHHQHILPSRESDVIAQSQNIAREAINSQLNPILQGITEMLSSLQMDNQNIKKTLNVQQTQIQDIRNIAKTQNHPSDIPQRPDALKQNTSVFNQNNQPTMHIMDDTRINHPHVHVHNVTRSQEVPSQNSINQIFNSPSRLSLTNQDNQISTRLQQGKAFKQALNDSSHKFNGIDAAEYAAWKKDLQSEIADLLLTANQELQILESRTDLEPLQIIKNVRYVKNDISAEFALTMAWKNLDKRYQTKQSPSQQLVSKLTRGPKVHFNDTSSLYDLAMHCQSAVAIRSRPSNSLIILDDPSTLDFVVNRLDEQLYAQWLLHSQVLEVPTFEHFADWATKWADLSHRHSCEAYNSTESKINRKVSTNTQIPPQNNSKSSQRNSLNGSKEYRDTVRRSRNSSPINTINQQSQQPRPREKPLALPARSPRSTTPSTPEVMCAWCTTNNMAHNHTTPDCNLIKNANAIDQWQALYKHRVCDRCLLPGHRWRDCTKNNPQCPECMTFHHPNIACRPLERISQTTYPNGQ